MSESRIDSLLAEFGISAKQKLQGVGEPEEALRGPVESLLLGMGADLGRSVVMEGEARLEDIGAKPDFAVRVNGAIVGYLEVKKPGLSIDPISFSGQNKRQWERLKGLPNLIYTNGTDWRLYLSGELAVATSLQGGPLTVAGAALHVSDSSFVELIQTFLSWSPTPIRSTARLVATIAPITALLREKVLEQLEIEEQRISSGQDNSSQVLLGLAADWRALLFPDASNAVFADGFAQTTTFGLLLARTEGISLGENTFHEIGAQLMLGHSLMGRALQLLTERIDPAMRNTADLLVRVIDAVDWESIRTSKDTYLHLYEHFLEAYDPALRKATGTYYTPHQVVEEMVRLTEDVLATQLGIAKGFRNDAVTTIDPAMGTGTFLLSILESSAKKLLQEEGPGFVPAGLSEIAKRLIGFEVQLGSYAVAQLRMTDLLRSYEGYLPEDGLPMYVADTLSDPTAAQQQIASGLGAISASRREANKAKSDTPVTVVIGNPPYGAKAEGLGGWIERGSLNDSAVTRPPLDAFKLPGNGATEFNLKNLYIYFWRWATWKVFESTPSDQTGVIAFITSEAYLSGPGFRGMREYLRRNSSEGWIIDLSPEGKRPPAANAIFSIETPVGIGIFVRRADNDQDVPARIRFRALAGLRDEKFAALQMVSLDDDGWSEASQDWTAPFTPSPGEKWSTSPALDDLFPWRGPGIAANRAWVYSPDRETLRRRWSTLVNESDLIRKRELFAESRDATLTKVPAKLPGSDTITFSGPFQNEKETSIEPILVGFRSLDRQWITPDARVLHAPSPPLWSARIPGQVFIGEQHSVTVPAGASPISFSALIPDLNYTDNRGGRVLPILHPTGEANSADGLLQALSQILDTDVTIDDLACYVAGVAAHGGFTELFQEELRTPGLRVPISRDADLFRRLVDTGRVIIWLQTYGASMDDASKGRPVGEPRAGMVAEERVMNLTAVRAMPNALGYDEQTETIQLLDADGELSGSWGPVKPEVLDYRVGGLKVVDSWFRYRRLEPFGRKSSDLDKITPESWPAEWSTDLTDLLTIVSRLISIEEQQRELLTELLAGDLLTKSDLAGMGVRWPTVSRSDHSPRRVAEISDSQLDIDI